MTTPPKILYDDNQIIVVIKPFAWLTQQDQSKKTCLMDWIKKYLKDKYLKPGNVFLGMIQRLDKPVAGILVFAKTSKAASRLSKQMREHQIRKKYIAKVVGKLSKPQSKLVHYLERIEDLTKVYSEASENRLKAELSYKVLDSNQSHSLLEIELITGRKHQIRAQLAALGHPIVGDSKYGSKEKFYPDSIALYSCKLSFLHPVSQKEVQFEI